MRPVGILETKLEQPGVDQSPNQGRAEGPQSELLNEFTDFGADLDGEIAVEAGLLDECLDYAASVELGDVLVGAPDQHFYLGGLVLGRVSGTILRQGVHCGVQRYFVWPLEARILSKS